MFDLQTALAAMQITDSNVQDWIPDSGATSHMAGDSGNFAELSSYSGSDSIVVGNGASLPITHTWESATDYLSRSFNIEECFVCSGYEEKLIVDKPICTRSQLSVSIHLSRFYYDLQKCR